MASYHFHLTQMKRSRRQSVIAQAAYRAGEKLYSTYYGESSDFTRKRGVVMAEICLPDHALREYADRETLWNALEWAEDIPRQCVFAGTSNVVNFLPLDRSGNRRFLPIMCDASKAEVHILENEVASRKYIEQMWAG